MVGNFFLVSVREHLDSDKSVCKFADFSSDNLADFDILSDFKMVQCRILGFSKVY